jgi:hypothetical protein
MVNLSLWLRLGVRLQRHKPGTYIKRPTEKHGRPNQRCTPDKQDKQRPCEEQDDGSKLRRGETRKASEQEHSKHQDEHPDRGHEAVCLRYAKRPDNGNDCQDSADG